MNVLRLKANSSWPIILIMAAATAVRLIGLSFPFGDYDEGVYLATVRSLTHGLSLYAKTYNTQGPVFFYLGEIFYRISPTIQSVRLISVTSSLLVVCLTYLLVRKYIGQFASYFAALYLSLNTFFLVVSRTFQLDIPWLALSMGSFYFLLRYDETDSYKDLLCSALFFGLSILLKLNPLLIPVIIVYFAWRFSSKGLRSILSLLCFAIVPLILLGIFIPIADLHTFYETSIRVRAVHVGLFDWAVWLQPLRKSLIIHELPVIIADIFAMLLIIFNARKKGARRWLSENIFVALSLVWLAVTTIAFQLYGELFPHHFVFFILPSLLVASWFFQCLYDRFSGLVRRARLVAILLLAVIYAAFQGGSFVKIISPTKSPFNLTQERAADYIKANTSPNDYVITDDQIELYLSDRNTPSELVDTSRVNIQSGLLTAPELINLTKQYQPKVVTAVSGRFNILSGYISYLKNNYQQLDLGNGATVFTKNN